MMRNGLLLLAGMALSICQCFAQVKYKVSDIAPEMRQGANVVVREKNVKFDILSTSKATYKLFEATTILDASARKHAIKTVFYDELTKVVSLRASIYDANGTLIKKLKQNDFEDRSAISGYSLYEDDRVKVANLSVGRYPITIELEYELEYKFLFQIPSFYPVWDEKMSTQLANYTVTFNATDKPRFLTKNIDAENTTETNTENSVSWTFKNLKPFANEKFGPSWTEIFPCVFSAPSNFEYDGYSGAMDTWSHFGNWITTLNKGRDELSAETKGKVKDLVDGLTSTEEKVKAVYKFLQARTRYVSIQLGIGGFQPLDAKTVDAVGYGDCKALSNYMVALLKGAGVKGYYTLIRAGNDAEPIEPNFPSAAFNHVIVFVPNAADTLWLECTSQTNPFNYQGSFTSNRNALAITDNGGVLIRTPEMKGKNIQNRGVKVVLNENGDASLISSTSYSGLQYEKDDLNFIINLSKDDQKKWIQENIQLPSFQIKSFSFDTQIDRGPIAELTLSADVSRLATVSGKRLFVSPNIMTKQPVLFTRSDTRKYDIVVKESVMEYDTVEFLLPPNLYPEFIPSNKLISNQFGSYETNYIFAEDKVVFYRKFILNKGRYNPEEYEELSLFNQEVTRSDNIKLAFLNKT